MAWLRLQNHVFPTAVGAFVCLCGVALLGAHWLQAPLFVQVATLLPSGSALGFVLFGVALFDSRPRVSQPSAIAVGLLGIAVLLQDALGVNLHVDQLIAADSQSGRMSPQTALCFIGSAAALLLWHSQVALRVAVLAQGLIVSLVTLAIVTLLGYCFDLELVYRWHGSSRMSALAAALFSFVGAALWSMWDRRVVEAGRFAGREHERVTLIASALIVLVAGVAGASGFILLAARAESMSLAALKQSLATRIELLDTQIDARLQTADRLADQLDSPEGAALARRRTLRSLLGDDVAAIRWQDAAGATVSAGRFAPHADHAVMLHDAASPRDGGAWFDGAILHVERELAVNGRLTIESPLSALSILPRAKAGSISSLLLCSKNERGIECTAQVPELQQVVARALAGERGTVAFTNARGTAMVAAFGPTSFGLAAVFQQDTDSAYGVLLRPRVTLAAILILVIVAGIALLRSQLRPLARQASEARAAAAESGTLTEFAKAQLLRANERFRVATQAARLVVFEWDLATGELIWDEVVHELHNLPPDVTPTYENWRRMVHPDDQLALENEVAEAFATGRDIQFEFRILMPDCRERSLRTAASVARDAQGNPTRTTGVVWDVTERRRLERMKSEFVSVVSHELRTPLTSIRGALGLITGTSKDLPEQTRQLFDIAYRNTDRLALLVSDILDVEKIESGGVVFANEALNVREVVEQAIENNQAYAAERDVRLQLITSNDNVTVMADANRLLQVMANLLSNAAKFSPTGAPVDIAILPLPNAVRISVRDYGPGIPETFQPHVFHKFAQADASDTRAKGGTGLGLAISKAIVERLGGRIGYDNAPGVGTLFYFDLPVAQDMTQSGAWHSPIVSAGNRTEST